MPVELQEVDVSVAANDNQGDKGRNAFIKVNENSEVIAAAIEDAERKAYVVPITEKETVVEAGDWEAVRMPYAFVLLEVRASLEVADSSADIDIDITENGASIFASGDILTVPAGSRTSVGYSPAPDVRYVLLEDDNRVKFTVQGTPGGTAAGLKVTLIGYVIWTTF